MFTKKMAFIAILFTGCAAFAFSQANVQGRPVLGVLPFFGGAAGEGETIATLFSHQPAFLANFTVVTRTGAALEAIFMEHDFQLTGLTDSDTIAGLGRLLNADYVLSGSIRRLGDRNLLIATVVNVESFEQVAGHYHTYRTLGEIQGALPSISQTLVNATLARRNIVRQNNLAIVPFAHLPGIDPHDAYTLTQILTIELLATGYYAILPRTTTIQSAIAEQEFQMQDWTADEGMVALGHAVNAEYVLNGTISRLGGTNMFMAQILRVEDGSVFVGASRNYGVITDGIYLMVEIAILLTDPANAEERIAELNLDEGRAERRRFLEAERRREADEIRRAEAEARRQERIARREQRTETRQTRMQPVTDVLADEDRRRRSVRNEVEQLSLFFCWETGGDSRRGAGSAVIPVLLPSGIYWSPVSYTVIGFETRMTSLDGEIFRSVAPTVGLVWSFGGRGRVFTNFLLEMGNYDRPGLITNGITPGFDIGVAFDPGIFRDNFAFINIKYRCIWFEGRSSHAFGIGISFSFEAIMMGWGAVTGRNRN